MDIDKLTVTKLVKYMFIVDEDDMLVSLNQLIQLKEYDQYLGYILRYFAIDKTLKTNLFNLPDEAPMLNEILWVEYKIEIGMQIIEELANTGRIDERDEVILGKRLRGEPVVRVVKFDGP